METTLTAPVRNLLSPAEAAEFLGVQPQTLAVWRSTKRYPDLRYIRVGNSIRYRLADLEHWLAERTVGGAEEK